MSLQISKKATELEENVEQPRIWASEVRPIPEES